MRHDAFFCFVLLIVQLFLPREFNLIIIVTYGMSLSQQMERFKVVERETKTKAYSKEGLTSGTKMDPAERERCEVMQWLNECLEKLNIQMDQFEAEIETLGGASKKKRRGGNSENADAIEEFNQLLAKHRDHVQKLETLLRMLDNDTVNINQVSLFVYLARLFAI